MSILVNRSLSAATLERMSCKADPRAILRLVPDERVSIGLRVLMKPKAWPGWMFHESVAMLGGYQVTS
jgi:hypothetical protein